MTCVCACSSPARPWWEETPNRPTATPPTALSIINILFESPGLQGGSPAVGRVSIDRPAGAGGQTIALTSSNPVLSVPASVQIAAGDTTATFMVSTSATPRDVRVEVAGSSGNVSGTTTVDVWALLPTSFTWWSDAGETIGRGGRDRLTPEIAIFVARCEREDLWMMITGPNGRSAFVTLGAPRGSPLRPGVYEGARGTGLRQPNEPGLDVSVNGTGCGGKRGRFEVLELDFSTTGNVRRFVGTFEQYCDQSPASALRGELRLSGPFQRPPFALTCVR